MITYEDFFSAKDVATFKRVKHGQMHLSRTARRVLAEMVGGEISKRGKEFVRTEHGLYRLAMAENSDNSTERESYERLGIELVVMGSRRDVTSFMQRHGCWDTYGMFLRKVRRQL